MAASKSRPVATRLSSTLTSLARTVVGSPSSAPVTVPGTAKVPSSDQ
ncbi:hypothetical protein [Blastococcus sp. TML/M2B]|nr:hypothetical protein [Blastococcus sp. TML/M2B]